MPAKRPKHADRKVKLVFYVAANPGCSRASAVEACWPHAGRADRTERKYAYDCIASLVKTGHLRMERRKGSGGGYNLFPAF